MRGVLPTAVVFVAATTLGVAGWAASRGPDAPELGNLLDDVVAAGAPGVLLVVREEGEARSEVRGLADRSRPIPMRDGDRFRIGSLTKTFVATLVLRLVEDGRLRLDDSVEQWLPGLIPGGREITVRHLLQHTAGLFDYVADDRLFRDRERHWTPRELVSLAIAHPPERSPPGRGFAYSSTNYIVLGLIAEKAGGARLGRLLEERLFGPLGLRGRCRHGMGDCGAASKSGREGILLGPLYGSRRPHLTLLGDTGSTRCDESNRTDLWELIVSGLVRSPSGDEVEDECRTRDPHERATLVSAVHDDELVRFRNLALEDAFQEELVVCREPVEKTCDLGPRGHLSQRTQHDGPRKS